jgi:hypothetical protein
MASRAKKAESEGLQGHHSKTARASGIIGICALISGFYGCAHEKIRSYDYCVVENVTEKKIGDVVYDWVAHCNGGVDVVFPRMIKIGDGIYYTSYTENADTVTLKGYIKTIEEIVR